MNRQEYLREPSVINFVDWFRKTLRHESGYEFSHEYERLTKGKSEKTTPWACSSIYDAYKKYEWEFNFTENDIKIRGSTYAESKEVLDRFSKQLRSAVQKRDDVTCHKICLMILEWGGVLGSEKKGNKKYINEMKDGLSTYLSNSKSLFESHEITLARRYKTPGDETVNIKMNAGFTKIYSLLCDNFIIYDGRVGAAVGLLVRLYCEEKQHIESVPISLGFYSGKAQSASVNRNPSSKKYKFKMLSDSSPVHIRNNLKANWLLKEALSQDCGKFTAEGDDMRKLEAALFMIGYRI